MKPTKINPRYCAEVLWGSGGTTAYRTNRVGTYYYSCSGHGGYVVLAEALTSEERQNIDQWEKAEKLRVVVHEKQIYAVVYADLPRTYGKAREKFRCPTPNNIETREVYFFEEDCAWSVLEHFTDVRLIGGETRDATHTFNHWYVKRKGMGVK